jgi:large subunit ribosomal protein L24
MVKLKIHKNDVVTVISGKDKGKSGKVLKVFPKKGTVIVEKVRFVKRHSRPTQKMPKGGILEKEAPIPVDKVRLICSKCNTVTSIGFKQFGDDDLYVRVCKKCNEMLDAR